jgi:hypothetical protein
VKDQSVRRALLAILTICAVASAQSQERVEIRLRGRFYTEPATVQVTIAVQPDIHNRALLVAADGERLFRSSEVALDGEHSQRIHMVEFKNLPAGQYVLRAEVHSSNDVRAVAEQLLTIGAGADSR